MAAARKDALFTLALLTSLLATPLLADSTTASAPAPASAPASVVAATAPAAPTVIVTPPAVTQPFVGTITADKVYVRSGPGSAYYELGQLGKGDTVRVVGSRLGWYQILPPNGTFCLIAKEFVDADSAGATATVKSDYVNLRAGTAYYQNREPSAVLTVVRKGEKLTIVGSTDKYYKVAPTAKAYVFISPQFVAQSSDGTEYKIPDLRLPAGAVGPNVATVTSSSNTAISTVEITPATEPSNGIKTTETTGSGVTATTEPTETHTTVVVPPTPTAYAPSAYSRFSELNTKTQDELRKPLAQRDLDSLVKQYKDLLTTENLPPSVKQGSEARISALDKMATLQRLQKEGTASAASLEEQRKALQQQYEAANKAIEEYERTSAYLAEGRLQSSTAVAGKYALVNPATGRVVAYIDPASDVDVSKLLGQYIGVRGATKKVAGTEVEVIHVRNATLLPEPALPGKSAGK